MPRSKGSGTVRRIGVYFHDGRLVGHVGEGPRSFLFGYSKEWLNGGFDLSPLKLPFTSAAFDGHDCVLGLPGVLADCLPDAWGRKVMRNEFSRMNIGPPDAISMLGWVGRRGVGALSFQPDIESPHPQVQRVSLTSLDREVKVIEKGSLEESIANLAVGGTPGGAYPKTLLDAYPDGKFGRGIDVPGARPVLLKIGTALDPDQYKVEHVYMEMARLAGIRTATTTLTPNGKHLVVDRFDICEESQMRKHFHSLAGLNHLKADELDYRDLYDTADRLDCFTREREEITRRMIFNLLSGNNDDHGKNHGFLYDGKKARWSLTPAFDVSRSGELIDRGMTVGFDSSPSPTKVWETVRQTGLRKKRFKAIRDDIVHALSLWSRKAKEFGVPNARIVEIREVIGIRGADWKRF